MKARPKHVWIGFLEAREFVPARAWVPVIVEVSPTTANAMADAFNRMGVTWSIAKDCEVVRGKLDDARRICRVCDEGRGTHICALCQEHILTSQLVASVERVAS